MKTLILTPLLILSCISFGQWRIDFGVEAQINQNKIQKWELFDRYDPAGVTLSVLDIDNDTLDIYFNKFNMSNNFEIPIYFRLNRNRHFIDIKLSNSFNTIKMEGYSNYNRSFYEFYYGTYADFEAQAIADGFPDVDTADYEAYISSSRNDWESNITYTESFQLLSLTANYGFRFLPHKSIKPFVGGGFSIKGKYRKVNYDYLRFSNDYIQDVSAINESINDFSEISGYFNMIAGFELYRFRLSAYLQWGFLYSFPTFEYDPNQIVYVNTFTAFDNIYSFGFNLGVDLFRHDFGKDVKKDNVTKDDFEVSKIKRKKDKWDFGVRFNRRGFNELTTFYGLDSNASHHFATMRTDSVLVNVDGTLQEGQNIEVVQFGDVKRIGWSGQFDIFGTAYFGKRWLAEFTAGYSYLNFDVETKELVATVAHDSLGLPFYVESSGSPRLRSGAYRKSFDLIHLNPAIGFKVVDKDIFDLRIKVGGGITLMIHRFQGLQEQPDGVNELESYFNVEETYYDGYVEEVQVYDGPMTMSLADYPESITDNFSPDVNLGNWSEPRTLRQWYPTMKFGVDATIDRFSLGMSFESVIGYMDGFMLDKYASIYFSIGYKIWSR